MIHAAATRCAGYSAAEHALVEGDSIAGLAGVAVETAVERDLAAVAELAATAPVPVVAVAARAPGAAHAVVAVAFGLAAADEAGVRTWIGLADRVAALDGLSSHSAAPAVSTQEQRWREAKTEELGWQLPLSS